MSYNDYISMVALVLIPCAIVHRECEAKSSQDAPSTAATRPENGWVANEKSRLLQETVRLSQEKARLAAEEEGTDDLPSNGLSQGESASELFIPKAITALSIARIKDVLVLSEMQSSFLDAVYQQYRQDDAALRKSEINPLWKQSAANAAKGSVAYNPMIAQDYERIMKQRDRAVLQINALRETVFTSLDPVVSDAQRLRFNYARDIVTRESATFVPRSTYVHRAAALDLSLILYQYRRTGSLEVVDVETFDRLLQDYESTLTVLRVQHRASFLKAEVDGAKNMSAWPRLPVLNDPNYNLALAEFRLLRAEFSRIWRRPAALERRIRDHNSHFLLLIADTLNSDTSIRLVTKYRVWSYPQVYPDPFDPEQICRVIIALPTTAADQAQLLGDLLDGFRQKQDDLSERMCIEVSDWADYRLRTHGFSSEVFEAYKSDLRALQASRANNARKLASNMREALGAALDAKAETTLLDFNRQISSHKEQDSGLDFRP